MASLLTDDVAGLSLVDGGEQPVWGRSEDIVRAMRNMHDGFRAFFMDDFAALENEENDETCARGIGEYLNANHVYVRPRPSSGRHG